MQLLQELIGNSGIGGQTGIWMLALFLLGLSIMGYLTVREASLYESQVAARYLKKRPKAHIPSEENLTAWSRFWLQARVLLRGREFREAMEPATSQGAGHYEMRLRREIDKLVGKDVYHGQKEQL